MNIKKVVVVVTVILLLILFFQNAGTATLNFFFWQISMPGIFLFPLIFILGIATGWILSFILSKRKNENDANS